MTNPHLLAAALAIGFFFAGNIAMGQLMMVEGFDEPHAATIGFAISTPAGLMALGYIADEFDLPKYLDEKPLAAVFGDFLLAILAAGVVGMAITLLLLGLVGDGFILWVFAGLFTFGAAIITFYFQANDYFHVAE